MVIFVTPKAFLVDNEYTLHKIEFAPRHQNPFPCWNSQSIHLHLGKGATFIYTRHIMKRFIRNVHRGWPRNGFENGFETPRKQNRISSADNLRWRFNLFLSHGLSSVRKSYLQMDLHDGISSGTRKSSVIFDTRFRVNCDSVKRFWNAE